MNGKSAAIQALLNPRSVVHVGASETGLYPAGIFGSLAASETELFAVNPNRESVFGRHCYQSIRDLPLVPDLAMITVDRRRVGAVLADCVRSGIKAAVVISSGFAEAGGEGAAFQKELEAFASSQVASRGSAILILGPNCAGFANLPRKLVATRLAGTCCVGGISFVSQSGALMMALHGSFAARGAGLRYLVSVGNQLDLSAEDLLAFFADDPGTRVSAAFLESVKDGRAFIRALESNLHAEKPVVLVKAGRTDTGSALAATHTAAAAGASRVFEAVCAQYGATLVDDIEDLVSTALLFDSLGTAPCRRIAWITQSGGLGSLLGDHAHLAGMTPLPFSGDLQKILRERELVPEYQPILNPVDLRGESMRGSDIRESLEPFARSDEVDCIGILFAKSPYRPIEAETARALATLREEYGKPIVVVWVGNTQASYLEVGLSDPSSGGAAPVSAIDLLREAGIPVFFQAGEAVRALSRVVRYREFRSAWVAGQEGEHAAL